MGIFHGWDQWKSAMMTLPEDTFFDLLRSVFGNVKTPFNKQNLLSDLAAFLSRDDIRRNIAAYIDEADAQVIAAVALLGNPTASELEQFFAGDGMGIPALLLNLEERFILYRYREGGILRLGLNPVLEPVLAVIAEDRSRIFPSQALEDKGDCAGGQGECFPDGRFFAALVSFVLEEGSLFRPGRTENRLRKKIQDSGRRLFPGVDLEQAIRGLLCLGLCRPAISGGAVLPEDPPDAASTAPSGAVPGPEGEVLKPDERVLGAFAALEPRHRQIYWAAGLCLGADPAPEYHLIRGKIRSLARLTCRFLDFLSPGRLYPPQTLRRILFSLEREEHAAAGLREDSGFTQAAGFLTTGALCAALVQAGLLRGTPQAYGLPASAPVSAGRDIPPGPGVSGGIPVEPGAPVLALDAPLFCLVYPGIDCADALALAFFSIVRETGPVFRFEITRESCLRGFERGMGAADMGKLLTRLSGNRLEPSLLWTLEDWEKRSAEVSLFEGAVLVLSPERYYLAEAEPLASLIRRELVPGLYLLDSGDLAADALRRAGVDIFTRQRGRPAAAWDAEEIPAAAAIHALFPPPEKQPAGYQDTESSAMMNTVAPETPEPVPPRGNSEAEALKTQFHQVLNGRALSAPERNELASRVERKLVLAESQLSSASVRGEKLEARNLDYVGKASIAKYAISSRSLVEVVWPAGDGEQRMVGMPLALEKSGKESILVIEDSRVQGEAETPGGSADIVRVPGDTIRIPLGKISLVRRIKKSMFET
ncbi:MAG: hypothetical protein LBP20_09565 [Treponema sp.]|jgi:hypothetical protein|nr:hypothetical protein [Treponema sp.]